MTPKQILDSFSETLMLDERILSAQERALVCTLLQHARAATGEKPETQEAVRAVIASAIGETVAQLRQAAQQQLVVGVLGVADDEDGAGGSAPGGQGAPALLEAAQLSQGGAGVGQQRLAEIG